MQPRLTLRIAAGRVARAACLLAPLLVACATTAPAGAPPPRVTVTLQVTRGAGAALPPTEVARPLDTLVVRASGGAHVIVSDGRGRDYARVPLVAAGADRQASLLLGGALGSHHVRVEDAEGRVLSSTGLRVDCETGFEEESAPEGERGPHTELLAALHDTMKRVSTTRLFGRDHQIFVPWIRDHTHVLKAMKYFHADLRSGVDLYRDTQRADGMIWDNHERAPHLNNWDERFEKFGFVGRYEDVQFRRIPVEADVEYLYVEAIWYVWKATGDDAWLARTIPSAARALRYSMTDPIRWSKQHQLVRRGYTIDTWDFQHEEDAAILGDPMKVDPERTRFGIMHGDNTGLAASSRYLAEMLEHLGRKDDAAAWRRTADTIQARLDRLAWNGRFYTHHVAEDPGVTRDLGGTDPAEQVSLSNAYALSRGLPLDKRVAIIETYQRIRANLPPGSPGEWYTIFPIFEKGFGRHNQHWQYMNGGVITIVAGELARGAFDSGQEAYGSDILRRVLGLSREHGGRLPVTYRGADPPPRPAATYRTVPLGKLPNVALTEEAAARYRGKSALPAWGTPGNDLPGFPRGRQTFHGVPFDIPSDEESKGRVALGLLERRRSDGKPPSDGHLRAASVPVGGKARSLWFLHAVTNTSGQVGTITLHYTDGSRAVQAVTAGREILPWWYPELPGAGREQQGGARRLAIAWEGRNPSAHRVGVSLYALDNPQPDKDLARVELVPAANDARWYLLGLTLSDQPGGFDGGKVSFGIPDSWGAAAVAYALIEGLAGIEDAATRFERARVAPRWPSAGVEHIVATAKYPASEGYVRYRYHAEPAALRLDVTGSGSAFTLRVLLPDGVTPRAATLDGAPVAFAQDTVGASRYVTVTVGGVGVHRVAIAHAAP